MALCKYCSKLKFSGYRNCEVPDFSFLGPRQSVDDRDIRSDGDSRDNEPAVEDENSLKEKSDVLDDSSRYAVVFRALWRSSSLYN